MMCLAHAFFAQIYITLNLCSEQRKSKIQTRKAVSITRTEDTTGGSLESFPSLLPHVYNNQCDALKWYQFVCNDEVTRITKQPNLTVITQSRRLSIFGHTARMDDDADAKMILMASPSENWKRPPGRPHIMWLNIIQRDLRAYNLTLNEAVDLAQNRPLWRLMSTYGATHS